MTTLHRRRRTAAALLSIVLLGLGALSAAAPAQAAPLDGVVLREDTNASLGLAAPHTLASTPTCNDGDGAPSCWSNGIVVDLLSNDDLGEHSPEDLEVRINDANSGALVLWDPMSQRFVIVDATPQAPSMDVTVEFDYQVCADGVCAPNAHVSIDFRLVQATGPVSTPFPNALPPCVDDAGCYDHLRTAVRNGDAVSIRVDFLGHLAPGVRYAPAHGGGLWEPAAHPERVRFDLDMDTGILTISLVENAGWLAGDEFGPRVGPIPTVAECLDFERFIAVELPSGSLYADPDRASVLPVRRVVGMNAEGVCQRSSGKPETDARDDTVLAHAGEKTLVTVLHNDIWAGDAAVSLVRASVPTGVRASVSAAGRVVLTVPPRLAGKTLSMRYRLTSSEGGLPDTATIRVTTPPKIVTGAERALPVSGPAATEQAADDGGDFTPLAVGLGALLVLAGGIGAVAARRRSS